MSTAVLISGDMCMVDRCYPSIRKHLLEPLGEHTVFVHVCSREDAKRAEILKPSRMLCTEPPPLDEKNYVHRTGRGTFAVAPLLREIWALEAVNSLRLDEEKRLGRSYDWVVWLNPNIMLYSSIEDLGTRDPTVLHLPAFSNFWGYNGRFAYGGGSVMGVYCDRLRHIDDFVAQGGVFHAESLLKWIIDRARIQVSRSSVLFDTLMLNGVKARPVWVAGQGDCIPEWMQSLTDAR